MYENLLSLPYFQGMSKNEITAILDKVTIEFFNHTDSEPICKSGDDCNRLIIVTKGEVSSIVTAPDGSYSLTEEIQAPLAVEPYSLFGQDTTFKRDYVAKGSCTTLVIDKKYLFSEFAKYQIFTINLLNLIAQFIGMRCNDIKGAKRVCIKMERLASILCETRLNISKALNELQNEGYIELHRKEIFVPSLARLINETKE